MTKTTDYVAALRGTSSRLSKEAILASIPHEHSFWRVVSASFDMNKMYYITSNQVPPSTPTGGRDEFVENDFVLLDMLSSRCFTGNQALRKVTESLTEMGAALQETFLNILDKDFGCGVGEKTINKIRPNTVSVFEAQLAEPFNHKKVVFPSYVQTKLDGMRILSFMDQGDVSFVSRNGKPVLTLDHLKPQLLSVFGSSCKVVVDGEVKKPGHFNDTISAVKRDVAKDSDTEFYVFDCLEISEFNTGVSKEYQERYKILSSKDFSTCTHVKLLSHTLVNTIEQINDLFEKSIDQGHEGIIIKNTKGLYRRARTSDWIKMKAESSVDVPIIGFKPGKGKYEGTLGAVLVDYQGKEVSVSGMVDAVRDYLWNNQEATLGRIIEVKYHEETPDGSLRHPRMKKFRTDKDI